MFTLAEALAWFYLSMEGVKSPATVKWYRQRLGNLENYLGGETDVSSITERSLLGWRANLAQKSERWTEHPSRPVVEGGLSPDTLRGYVRAARRLYRWLIDGRQVDINPAQRLEMPPLPERRRRGISTCDRKRMEAAADCPRDLAIMLFMADTGCRLCGVAGLRMDQLNLGERRAVVWEKGRGGKKKSRAVFMTQKTTKILQAWLIERPTIGNCNYVFLGLKRGGKRAGWHEMTESGIYQILKRTAQRAGVESGWNPHNWRHGAIRAWLNNGMPLSKASQLAGHSSTKVTGDIYGTSNEDELAADHDRWGWVEENPQAKDS